VMSRDGEKWVHVRSSGIGKLSEPDRPDRPDLLRLRMPTPFPRATGCRYSSVQISTTSIICFARVLTAFFALRGCVTACTPRKFPGIHAALLGMACTGGGKCVVGVLYDLTKERNVKRAARILVIQVNSVVFNGPRL
jgi:hypothetical protein